MEEILKIKGQIKLQNHTQNLSDDSKLIIKGLLFIALTLSILSVN